MCWLWRSWKEFAKFWGRGDVVVLWLLMYRVAQKFTQNWLNIMASTVRFSAEFNQPFNGKISKVA